MPVLCAVECNLAQASRREESQLQQRLQHGPATCARIIDSQSTFSPCNYGAPGGVYLVMRMLGSFSLTTSCMLMI
jgi:hypothetical protein